MKTKIVIFVSGGVVQSVASNDPRAEAEVIVVDYDDEARSEVEIERDALGYTWDSYRELENMHEVY